MKKKLLAVILSFVLCGIVLVTVPTDICCETKVVHSGDDINADIAEGIDWNTEVDDSEVYYADDLDYSIRFTSFEYVEDPHNYHIYYPQIVYNNKRDASKANKTIRDKACIILDKMYPKFTYDSDLEMGRNECTVTYEITYMDNDYISILFYDDYFVGSTFAEYHDMYSCTIDLKTQEKFTICDVFDGSDDLASIVFDNIVSNNDNLAEAPEFNVEIPQTLVKEGVANGRYNLGFVFLNGKIGSNFTYHYGDGNLILRGAMLLKLDYSDCERYMLDKSKWNDNIHSYIDDGKRAAEENEKKELLKSKKKKPFGFMF